MTLIAPTDRPGLAPRPANHAVTSLPAVIRVEPSLCVNCHACIAACPIKTCNRATDDAVEIDPDLCIGCGECIDACKHGARLPIDDFDAFWGDLKSGVKMVAVVAPAVAAAFPDRYRRLNGWLKRSGVAAVFDVSFGAELTVQSYVRHIEENRPATVVAQPCPALVSYIEIYHPELLRWLSPAGSPMQHAMAMVRRDYPQYRSHRIAVVSPCIAKKREFAATGLGDYNVTMASVARFLEANGVDLSRYPDTPYDGPQAERAVLFSSPGGLRDTLERWNPDAARATRKIEGTRSALPYLESLNESIADGIAPPLVDCLCCEKGCNGGTGTPARHLGLDRIEHLVARRAREARAALGAAAETDAEAQAAVVDVLLRHDPGADALRTYTDRSSAVTYRPPSAAEVQAVYARMSKHEAKDLLNCGACGYGSCEAMAGAIHNGLNRVENCVFYLGTVNREQERKAARLKEVVANFEAAVARITKAAESAEELNRVSDAIVRLSQQTHIVALNARIEAARAGEAGASFSVVSSAVRDLAGSIRKEAEMIEPCSKTLHEAFASVLQEVESLGQRVVAMLEEH